MEERKNAVTMRGKSLTLIGKELKVGDKAPDFTVVDSDLNLVKFSSLKGKPILLMTVPSLDTSVCSKETHKFSEELAKFKEHIQGVVVSMDLPFAQKRWCMAENVKNIKVFSDYQKRECGEKCGVLIKDLNLLDRCVLLIDDQQTVRHVHLVKEVTEEPNYQEILTEIKKLSPAVK